MQNKDLIDFYNAIHNDLKIRPNGCYFTINENGNDSIIKKVRLKFKNKDDVLIIRQNEQKHTVKDILVNHSTDCCCDFILFMIRNGNLQIYLCEIKSSLCIEHKEKAIKQFKASFQFLKYFISSYLYYNSKSNFDMDKLENVVSRYYIYPSINGMSNKTGISYEKIENFSIFYKTVELSTDDEGVVTVQDGYRFFV
ncbi:hypothetical protein [uncultured Campylobacter sp.]|uniref:hypothetical protein n=1 Tax=uncultured Campylobacter sp. TaxID=218934 RepID=UPI0025DBBC02|nr:hypothetical protein [uncultured Campylobacter sp.]